MSVPIHLQLFSIAVLLAFLGWVLRLIRAGRLSLRDSLSWLLSTGIALLFVLFPGLLRGLAQALQIQVPSNALFALAFLYVLWNLLATTIAMSRQAVRVRRLTQECAILRAELQDVRSSLAAQASQAGTEPEKPRLASSG